jgi:hypothetical protein
LFVGFIVERLGALEGHNEVNIDGCKDGMLNAGGWVVGLEVGALDGEIGLLDGNVVVGRIVDFDGLLVLFVGFCVVDLLGVRVGILVDSRVGKLLDGRKLGLFVATLGLADDVQVVVVYVGLTVDGRKLGNSVGVTVASLTEVSTHFLFKKIKLS